MLYLVACAYDFAPESNVCGTVSVPLFAPAPDEAELWSGGGDPCDRDTGQPLTLEQSVPVDGNHFEATAAPGAYGVLVQSDGFRGCATATVGSDVACDASVTVTMEPYVAAKKPNLYLYPDSSMAVDVRLLNPSAIVASDPVHGGDGWRVTASPGGMLRTAAGPRDFLFYEVAWDPRRFQVEEGWCVDGAQAQASMEDAMRQLGFSGAEIADFEAAWDGVFPAYPRVTVYPQFSDLARLSITPAPDSFLRAWFYVVPGCRSPHHAELPSFAPRGFVATEWGVAFHHGLGPVVVE